MKRIVLSISAVIVSLLVCEPISLNAASATWSGATDGNWTEVGNWVSSVPGSNSATTTSSDTATFNNNTNTTITVDATRSMNTLLFNPGAGAYTFNSGAFYFNTGGGAGTASSIIVSSGVTGDQTFNVPMTAYRSVTASGFGFANNSLSANLILNGNVTGNSGPTATTTTLNLAGVGDGSINGVIANGAGALSVTKTGTGTWTLTGANTYTGLTQLTEGGLTLDFNGTSSPLQHIIGSGTTMQMGNPVALAASRTLSVAGKANTANTQTFAATTLLTGANHINMSTSGSGTATLNLGAFAASRSSGVTLDVQIAPGTNVTTTTALTAAGLLPNLVTINGTDFATKDGSNNIIAFTGYTANTATTLNTAGNQVVDMSGGNTTLTGTGQSTPSGVRFNTAAATTITLDPGRLLAMGGGSAMGALLVTPNVGANLTTITGGLLAGISSRDLAIYQNNTLGDLQIDSVVTSLNNNGLALTKSGAGKVILNGKNTFSSNTLIHEGTLVVTADATVGNSQNVTTTAAGAVVSGVDTTGLFIGQRVTGTNIPGTNQGLYIVAIDSGAGTVTLNSGTGVVAGTANVNFGNSGGLGTLTGASAVQVGSLATLQIGNGGATGSLTSGQNITNYGTVAINRSSDIAFANIISGTGGVSQMGAGTTTLVGTQTYTGATSVSGGTLLIDNSGSIANTSGVTVSAGNFRYDSSTALDRNVTLTGGKFSHNSASNYAGTLTFTSGTVGGTNLSGLNLTIGTGQTMAPGNSTGTMTSGNTTWANGGTFEFEINDATGTAGSNTFGWDLADLTSLDITAGLGQFTIEIVSLDALQAAGNALNFDGTSNYTWLFIDAGSAITGFNASSFILDDSAFANSAPGSFSITQGSGGDVDKLYLNYVGVIPEPSTYALLVGGLGLLTFLRRRKKAA